MLNSRMFRDSHNDMGDSLEEDGGGSALMFGICRPGAVTVCIASSGLWDAGTVLVLSTSTSGTLNPVSAELVCSDSECLTKSPFDNKTLPHVAQGSTLAEDMLCGVETWSSFYVEGGID